MGAKAGAWLNRALSVLAVLSSVVLVAELPWIASWGKLAIFATALVLGGAVAFKQIPAFDPLGRIRWRLPPRKGRGCAITFDDGPSADTPRVLEILALHRVKATFFVLSTNARRHPNILRRIAHEGHTVAVHGTTHAKIHGATEAAIEQELSTAIRELSELGVSPARLYRPPHGLKNSATFRVARRLGLGIWAWSRGIWDTDRPDPDVLVNRATRFACSRMVLLLHDGRGNEEEPDIEPMLAALPRILDGLRRRGFDFVTLDRA